ncbi:xin actin-binding repeat-containing protein 2 isoform X2 [Dunckerocampus dactyliophorus]|uniref:xin actin-binding repeat-containing protein 2 isoform X2 n=1 Tax=Dunckerocampus dactyliophorus TaxID=161453 RepID=UPI00240715B8|nr:xin actin-binding repeat-containing protein 2 isoform X2 [Dunckerocampus dactyliophorus]
MHHRHLHPAHRKEMSHSEVSGSSGSRQVVSGGQQRLSSQETTVSDSDNNLDNNDKKHENEEEEFPRYTTKELRAHFERTIEEAAPHKPIKIGRDISRSKWSSNVSQSNTATNEVHTVAAAEETTEAMMDEQDFPPPPPPAIEDSDYLPPPPPDLLQMPSDSENNPVGHYSPEPQGPANPSKNLLSREAYLKQKSMSELKRLYKHIHPELRKNIEEDFYNEYNETVNNQRDGQEYTYEEDADVTDEEYEWEEILPGDVQARRWIFENKPLDAIKDESPDEDGDNKRISEKEMILGKDVRRTAWMFETKTMDELGPRDANSTEYKFNKFDKGDVRAAAWLFETQTMDSLNKMHKEEELTKEIIFTGEDGNATIYMVDNKHMGKLGHTETIDESHLLSLRTVLEEINDEVKTITSTFDTQFKCIIMGQSSQMLEIISVRKIETELESSIASRWLFDTQPLNVDDPPSLLKLVCSLSMEDSNKGDWGRWLFEIKTLNSLDELESSNTEKEIVGADVRKHCLVFETQPMDSLKDDSNAKPQSVEDIIGGNVRSARNFFESSPQTERKNRPEVGKLQETLVNGEMKGDVRHQKWRFESQPLEHIRDERKEVTRTVNIEEDLTQEDGIRCRADVCKNRWVFETQPMDTLKDDSNSLPLTKEEIIAGNVKLARHYFETIPTEEPKELAEVGKLKRRDEMEEERGDVRHQKWRFESQPLEQIRDDKKEVIRTIDLEEIDKVDVSNYTQMFESTDFNRRDESQRILVEGVTSGSVRSNKNLFESGLLYAMQDSSGHCHQVKTVRHEEVVSGDVTTYKWMFETRPIDQFDESIDKYQIIKGISKQEIESGDVKTAKWLFETQPLDSIKYFSNIEDEEMESKGQDVMKGDVKSCKWLFETQPMDVLYEKVDIKSENQCEEIPKGDVKTCTWLFETQALDSIRDETETTLKTCTVNQEDIRGKDVRTACFLFETEKLENLSGKDTSAFKRITEIDIATRNVSRKKYIFEHNTSDIITSTSEEEMQHLKRVQTEDIQKGNVLTCRWLFENQSIDGIHEGQEESARGCTVTDVHGGDVEKGRFIFETFSLDKIKDAASETELSTTQIVCGDEEKGDVRNYTMMFETQPLYAIQDKDGYYHEVTTVTSEEVTRGDVVGRQWLFETKPLDAIKDSDEVYVIKSVTQQDEQKGDVTSAKWRFETQPLDRICEDGKLLMKTVEDIQGGNVKMNKDRFESDAACQESVRTVDVSEIQKGDVRTARWRFETQSIDKIRSLSSENLIESVKKDEVAKGDVKHSVWLFEKNPLDHIKEVDEDEETYVAQEEILKADVKSTTWLFETTPFDDFNETRTEKTEILGKSVKGTLEELYSQKMVTSKGILIESDEIGDVRMAKYHLMNQQSPEIQREEVIRGDLQTIMMNLLNRQEKQKRQVVIESEEKGHISTTVRQLFNQGRTKSIEKEEIIRGDIQEAIDKLFGESSSAKHGMLIQEDEKGDVRMTIYSLLNKQDCVHVEKEGVVRGDIKSTLQRLSSQDQPDLTKKITIDDTEKGNVHFYSTCIESGALSYLKQLHLEPDEEPTDTVEKEKIIGGDIEATKVILSRNPTQVERTVDDVIPGDVHNTVKVFMTEPVLSSESHQKEEIVKGNLKAALTSLSESVNQTVVVEKEEVVKGNIPKTLRCLERAQNRHKEMDKPDIIPGNIKGALRSLEKSTTSRVEAAVEDLVPGDVKATLRCLELAKQSVREVEKEEIVRGDIHTAIQCLNDASAEKRVCQQEIDVQGDVKGTIQLLMEPTSSPKMQRSWSMEELKGGVKMSIKSLYETHEQAEVEKEEVVKGDVKGTIKSLLETAQRETPKVRHGAYRRIRVKQRPPVKNLNAEAQRNAQKIKTAVSAASQSVTNETESVQSKSCTVERSTKLAKTVVEHKTIKQNHGIKTLKTDFCNLKPKGMIRLNKTKVETKLHTLKAPTSEPDLPLPPPPPVLDIDLPPPPMPPPPSVDSDIDHLPPPPPPLTNEEDFLPPPPPQQELGRLPAQAVQVSPAEAKKMTVKKVKAPTLCPVPKLELKVESYHEAGVTKSMTTTRTSKTSEVPPPPARKVCIPPIKVTPPPSPPPQMRGKASKFNTPLIKAEEKYRKLKEDSTPPSTPTPPYVNDALTASLQIIAAEDGKQTVEQSSDSSTSKQGNVTSIQQRILTGSNTVSSAKQEMVSNETSNVVSIQKASSVTSTRQKTLKTVSVSSKLSTRAVVAEQVHTAVAGLAKTEKETADEKKRVKSLTVKTSEKSERKKDDAVEKVTPETPEQNLKKSQTETETKKETSEKAAKVSDPDNKSTSGEKVSDAVKTTEKTEATVTIKTGTANQKVGKRNNHETQPDVKMAEEKEVEEKLPAINESTKIKAELKQEIKTLNVIDSQPEASTPTKKKKKSKKSKGGAQSGQSKDAGAESKAAMTERTNQTLQAVVVSEEHVEVKKEEQQKAPQNQLEGSRKKKAVTVVQRESRADPIKTALELQQNEKVKSTSKVEVPGFISHMAGIQALSKTVLGGSAAEETTQKVDTKEKRGCEIVEESATGTRISKISIGSTKVQNQTKTSHESRKGETIQVKSADLRAPSPSLRTRPPSPTFITIESIRRTDSPQRVTPSPTLLHRPATPPTPPPRRCETPMARLTRITPSPTFDKAENLERLKDTTAKLLRGVTPPPLISPQLISEKKSEIVETPATFHQQIKPATCSPEEAPGKNLLEEPAKTEKDASEDPEALNANDPQSSSEIQRVPEDTSEPSSASVKEMKEFFQEAQKAEMNKTYTRKEPIAIPERLGPDLEQSLEERSIIIPLPSEAKEDISDQGVPTFDIQAVMDVFEMNEQSFSLVEEQRDQEEPMSSWEEATANTSKRQSPPEMQGGLEQSAAPPPQENVREIKPADPTALSESKSITEHFSKVDEFGSKVTTTRVSPQYGGTSTHPPPPFSYADAVKRKAVAARRTQTYDQEATENLLKNFHQTWKESETVFESLGYAMSEEMTSQVVSRHQTSAVSGSSAEVGAVHGVSTEGLPDGWVGRGQKEVP